jgi:hypothetical protein
MVGDSEKENLPSLAWWKLAALPGIRVNQAVGARFYVTADLTVNFAAKFG